jgi:hypothetical protein
VFAERGRYGLEAAIEEAQLFEGRELGDEVRQRRDLVAPEIEHLERLQPGELLRENERLVAAADDPDLRELLTESDLQRDTIRRELEVGQLRELRDRSERPREIELRRAREEQALERDELGDRTRRD